MLPGNRPNLAGFPYEVVRQLGQGGMGSVYEVRRPGDPRRLAAKVMTATSVQARARFQREGEVVARLDHPGIVPVRGSGQLADGTPYLLFDLVDGRSLKALLAEGPMAEPRALALAEGIARALGHAHRLGVVHRDIKPDNVLVDAQGAPKVADFGIAHVADAERLTRTGQVTGTVLYMAREQLAAGGGIGPWTDVHALGAVLFECLAGRPAFEGDSPHAVVAQVLHVAPPDLRALRPELSTGVAAIVARCLAKSSDERYPDGDALADDLAALRRGDSISAVSAFLRAARRRVARRAVVGVGAAAALVVLGAAGLWLRAERRREARSLDLRARAAELDQVAAQLGAEPSGRAIEAADRALARARELGATPDAGQDPTLGAALARLQAARDRGDAARALAALREGDAASVAAPVAALASALDALARVPATSAAPFEEGRGAALALAGRLEEARAALAPLADDPAPAGASASAPSAEGWLAAAPARRAWRLAWVELRLGRGEAALARVAQAPPALRLRLRLAALADAPPEQAARDAARLADEARALRGGELLAALARLEAQAASSAVERAAKVADGGDAAPLVTGARLDLLAELRRLSRSRLAAPHRARASLAEGELCLALGWGASAAQAFERAAALATAARADLDLEWPAAPAPVGASPRGAGPGRRLAAPDLAAALGLAAARATGPETAAALEAAEAARLRAGLAGEADPAAAWAATLAGALAVAPDQLGYVQAGHEAGPWGWDRARLLPWVGAGVRARLVADAWAALAVSTRTEESVAVEAAARPAEALSRAALAEDPGDDPARAARGWAALAAAQADLGQLEAARRSLERSRGLAGAPFEQEAAAAREALARGHAAGAVAALDAATVALDPARPRARVAAAMQLLGPFRVAFANAGQEVDALRVCELLAMAADQGQLPPSLRAQVHRLALRQAQALGRADAARRAEDGLRVATDDEAALRPHLALIGAALKGEFDDTPAVRAAFAAVLRSSPGDPDAWRNHHVAYGRYGNGGFDDLAIGFELDPWSVLAYLNSPSFSPRTMGATEAKTARDTVALLAKELGPPYDEVPQRRDDDVRLALGGLYALELRVPLEGDVLARGLAAADAVHRRAPGLVSSLLLGRLQLGAGDFGGAAETLARAAVLPEPLTLSVGAPRPWVDLWAAMARGGARRLAEARAPLERILAGPYRASSLQGHRVREEPLLYEDPALPGTLPAWAEEVAKGIDENR